MPDADAEAYPRLYGRTASQLRRQIVAADRVVQVAGRLAEHMSAELLSQFSAETPRPHVLAHTRCGVGSLRSENKRGIILIGDRPASRQARHSSALPRTFWSRAEPENGCSGRSKSGRGRAERGGLSGAPGRSCRRAGCHCPAVDVRCADSAGCSTSARRGRSENIRRDRNQARGSWGRIGEERQQGLSAKREAALDRGRATHAGPYRRRDNSGRGSSSRWTVRSWGLSGRKCMEVLPGGSKVGLCKSCSSRAVLAYPRGCGRGFAGDVFIVSHAIPQRSRLGAPSGRQSNAFDCAQPNEHVQIAACVYVPLFPVVS